MSLVWPCIDSSSARRSHLKVRDTSCWERSRLHFVFTNSGGSSFNPPKRGRPKSTQRPKKGTKCFALKLKTSEHRLRATGQCAGHSGDASVAARCGSLVGAEARPRTFPETWRQRREEETKQPDSPGRRRGSCRYGRTGPRARSCGGPAGGGPSPRKPAAPAPATATGAWRTRLRTPPHETQSPRVWGTA